MLSPIDKLLAIEEIRNLKSRYTRYVDSHDWKGFRSILTDDCIWGPVELEDVDAGKDWRAGGAWSVWDHPRIEGADAIVAWADEGIGDSSTIHMVFNAEIEILSETEAKALWAMEDILRFTNGMFIKGYGYYRERYRRVDGVWLISNSSVLRKSVEMNTVAAVGRPIV